MAVEYFTQDCSSVALFVPVTNVFLWLSFSLTSSSLFPNRCFTLPCYLWSSSHVTPTNLYDVFFFLSYCLLSSSQYNHECVSVWEVKACVGLKRCLTDTLCLVFPWTDHLITEKYRRIIGASFCCLILRQHLQNRMRKTNISCGCFRLLPKMWDNHVGTFLFSRDSCYVCQWWSQNRLPPTGITLRGRRREWTTQRECWQCSVLTSTALVSGIKPPFTFLFSHFALGINLKESYYAFPSFLTYKCCNNVSYSC